MFYNLYDNSGLLKGRWYSCQHLPELKELFSQETSAAGGGFIFLRWKLGNFLQRQSLNGGRGDAERWKR